MRSLTEERALEGGRSLGEHPAHGTDPHAFTLEDRDRELDDLAVEPVFVARLPGNWKTLLAADAEQLVVRQGQERYPAHTVLEVDAVLEADVGPDDRRLVRMRSFRQCTGLGQPVLEEVDAVPEAVVVVSLGRNPSRRITAACAADVP